MLFDHWAQALEGWLGVVQLLHPAERRPRQLRVRMVHQKRRSDARPFFPEADAIERRRQRRASPLRHNRPERAIGPLLLAETQQSFVALR